MGVYAHKTRENPGKRLDFRKKLGIPGKKICLCPIVQTNQTDFHTSGRDRRAVPKPALEPESAPAPKPRPGARIRPLSPKPCPGAGICARPKTSSRSRDPRPLQSPTLELGSAPAPKPRPGAGIYVGQKPDPESGVRTAGILERCSKVPIRARNGLPLDQIHPPSRQRIWPVR